MVAAPSLLKKLAGRRQEAIGLDIGSGSIKMADVVLRSGKPFLKRMAIVDVPEHAIEEETIADETLMADVLRRMAAKNGFAGCQFSAALGGRSLFIREVVFPRMPEQEMRQAIHWDLEQYVPYSPDQLYFDFWVVGPGATEVEVRVLLVAAPKDVVDTLSGVMTKAGLQLASIDIEPLAIQRTLPDTADCMLIDSGAGASQVTLFQKHSPVFTRNIPIGGNRLAEPAMVGMETGAGQAVMAGEIDRIVGELAGEVRRTLEYYQVQNQNVSISTVFITGGGAKIENLSAKLATILELPVILHDPLCGMESASSFNKQYLHCVGPQMAVAVGLALRGVEE